MADASEWILFVGNPGAGKSTLLNGIINKVAFKSGTSAGSGLTTVFQFCKEGNINYGDTPGLDDVKNRIAAAQEITKALQQNGNYRICFVLTLEAGRVRGSDIATLQIVLAAIQVPNISYGIIVNKVHPDTHAKIMANNGKNDFAAAILACLAPVGNTTRATEHVFFQPLIKDIDDQENKVPSQQVISGLIQFINSVPPTKIRKEDVKPVNPKNLNGEDVHSGFTEMLKQQNAILEQLAAMAKAIASRPPQPPPQPVVVQKNPPQPSPWPGIIKEIAGLAVPLLTNIFGKKN